MKKILVLLLLSSSVVIQAQMNNEKLERLLTEYSDSLLGTAGRWQLTLEQLPMMVITDETNDRMRIIAPITEISNVNNEVLLDCMAANFHSALDVKYALSNDVIWSVFIHPLSPLTAPELSSAIEQVYYAAATFGTTYSSTPLHFGTGDDDNNKIPKLNLKKI